MLNLNNKVAIIIPARYASKRYLGKPLVDIEGKTLIQRTCDAGLKAQKNIKDCVGVFVATDDERIKEHVEQTIDNVQVIMTSEDCENGTERVAQSQDILQKQGVDADIMVNLQGDSLLTPSRFIESLVKQMRDNSDVGICTPGLRCDLETYNNFKEDEQNGLVGGTTLTFDKNNHALYFSKKIIPYIDPNLEFSQHDKIPVFHHVGLYAYRTSALQEYMKFKQGICEKHEKLEQLRFLENGHKINVVEVQSNGEVFWEVNNPEDVARVAKHL